MRKKRNQQRCVAVVTGAGRRLGKHIARALGENGFDVVVNYHTSKEGAASTVREIQKLGSDAIAVKADIAKRKDIEHLVRQTMAHFHRVDLLVNNAAMFVDGTLESTSEQIWDATIDLNLKGTFFCSQAFAKIMKKQGSGNIINIASIGGLQAWTKHIPYNISKAGVIMLTKILAKSLAPHIRVNAIAPGTIIMKGEEEPNIQHVPRKTIPLRSYGSPKDIVDAILYLTNSANYMTGQILAVDGGRSIT